MRVKVPIRAKVTATMTRADQARMGRWHRCWHPNGKKRRVEQHRYPSNRLVTIPPGATYIRIPGYMEKAWFSGKLPRSG